MDFTARRSAARPHAAVPDGETDLFERTAVKERHLSGKQTLSPTADCAVERFAEERWHQTGALHLASRESKKLVQKSYMEYSGILICIEEWY